MNEVLTPNFYNLELTVANTEYYVDLPAGCQHFSFQARTAVDIRFNLGTIGKVAGPTAPYATVKSGGAFSSPEKLSLTPTSGKNRLYLASSTALTVVEVVAWTK